MKAITIRDLHAKTGQWLRQAARHGGIVVTDRGRPLARIIPESRNLESPYFANRKPSPAFLRLARRGKLSGGTDSTRAISEDRDGNGS